MKLKDIAKEAGVSVSTVSRVINKKGPHVARPELQNKIWEIVNRTGYVPNESAINLRKADKPKVPGRQHSIACLFARTPESINDPFFSQLARSVAAEAFKEGYHVQYSLTEIDIKQPSTLRNMMSEDIRGVVVMGRCDAELMKYLKKCFRFCSYTGLNPPDAKYDLIYCDGKEVGKAAVDYLVNLGHKKIAYIGEISNENRFLGYKEALKKHGIDYSEEQVVDVRLSTESGYRAASELLERDTGITAILCANDMTAIGVMRALQEMGIRVPQEISIMGIDNIEIAQYISTKLTTIHIPVEEMGQMATKILIDRINGGHTIHLRVLLPFHVVERESCSKPPKVPWRLSRKDG